MLRELLSIFRSDNPMHAMGSNFIKMLALTEEMTASAGEIVLGQGGSPEDRRRLYGYDLEVNRLEHDIRKRIVTHLLIPGNTADGAHCLALMSLVKDVERIGDYAKNLSELDDIRAEPVPEDAIVEELRQVQQAVESTFRSVAQVFNTSDRDRAGELIAKARGIAQQCDSLVWRISHSSYDGNMTAVLVLGARYYKRINGHLLNVLSSVVMPVYKIDYYDEDELPGDAGKG